MMIETVHNSDVLTFVNFRAMVERSQKDVWRLTPWLIIALLLLNFVLMAFDASEIRTPASGSSDRGHRRSRTLYNRPSRRLLVGFRIFHLHF